MNGRGFLVNSVRASGEERQYILSRNLNQLNKKTKKNNDNNHLLRNGKSRRQNTTN